MRRWVVGGVTAAAFLCLLGGPPARAVTFDPEAGLGDRLVELHWEPDLDDPVYTGNISLYPQNSATATTSPVRLLEFTGNGAYLWVWDSNIRAFVGLMEVDDTWEIVEQTGSLGGDANVVDIAVHPEGLVLMAGLDDGQIAVWRREVSSDPTLYAGHEGACRGLTFRPLATSRDTSYVSIGDDGYWRQWKRPGRLDRESLANPTGPLTALGITRSGDMIAVGNPRGGILVYSMLAPDLPELVRSSHGGLEIAGLVFSTPEDRLASADVNGGVRLWEMATGDSLGGLDPAEPDPIIIRFSPRDSEYLNYARSSGTIGVFNGFTCQPYQVEEDFGRPVTGFVLATEGGRGYFGDATGTIEWWFQGPCVPSPETPDCFGGYYIYRGLYPEDTEPDRRLPLLRVFDFSDSTWGWESDDSTRSFADPDSLIPLGGDSTRVPAGPHNGMPYYYCIRKFYWTYLDGGVFWVGANTADEGFYRAAGEIDPTSLSARVGPRTERPRLQGVYVVPDPYIENDPNSRYGPLGEPLVRFFNLPVEATIRIYTSNGDLVRTLEHYQTHGDASGGSTPWDLQNSYGQDVTAGVYLYSIVEPGGESARGFFTLVR